MTRPGVTPSCNTVKKGSLLSLKPDQLSTITQDWLEYVTDACQRGVLYLDLLRRRGNEEEEITSRPMATVLGFDHELLMSGRSLPRPINFALVRVVPPPGIEIDRRKRPVVVVDPRAGQGPGIGGFKAQSEIGDALAAGHPVYFIGFCADPDPGQKFLDVVDGHVKFFERVVELHPDAPRPFAIGNCQAGYQTLMVATLRPDLFGQCLVAGSPMSYWQGVHGKNPMRYAGGLLGGSWLTALTSALARGSSTAPGSFSTSTGSTLPTGCGESSTMSMPMSTQRANAISGSRNGGATSSS